MLLLLNWPIERRYISSTVNLIHLAKAMFHIDINCCGIPCDFQSPFDAGIRHIECWALQ